MFAIFYKSIVFERVKSIIAVIDIDFLIIFPVNSDNHKYAPNDGKHVGAG